MTLNNDQLRQAYFELIKGWTNNFHDIAFVIDAPLTIQLAMDKMHNFFSRDGSVSSEKISDLALTFTDINGLPNDVRVLIDQYNKVRW